MRELEVRPATRSLLGLLTEYDVSYLVLGGHAVTFYGVDRPPDDLDLLIEPTLDNARLVLFVLEAFGHSPSWTAADLAQPGKQVTLTHYPIELLTSAPSFSFEVLSRECQLARVGKLTLPVVSKRHLMELKGALGRPSDLEDVKALEVISS